MELVAHYTEEELQTRITEALKAQDQDNNDYSTKKSYGQHYLNITGIMQLVSLFLAVFSTRQPLDPFQIALIVLICISISLQFIIFVLVTILANSKTEQLSTVRGCTENSRSCVCTATSVNNLVTSLSGLLLIISAAVTTTATYAKVSGVPSVSPANGTAL